MQSDVIKEVNVKKKKFEGIMTVAVFTFVTIVAIYYIVWFRALLADTIFGTVVGHIKMNIAAFSALGSLYTALFGGLFFLLVPMEAYFLNALNHNSPVVLYGFFFLGMLISYPMDYFIGMKLFKISRKLVSPKKFYKIKTYINRYGKAAIFAAHAIPFFPSQQVTFILGVFRYNKGKLFMIALPAQMLKYSFLIAVYSVF